jgi:hypothetical protein
MMKLILGAAMLAALMAGAAYAETPAAHHAMDNGNAAMRSYAASPAYGMDGVYDQSTVVNEGRIVGRDPDPTVRLQILKDADLPDAG